MLISILKIVKPKVVFEYGTFLGYSTFIFIKNTPKNCKVFSIDLGTELNFK
jgi:predicted O-methyltransferase YrrM